MTTIYAVHKCYQHTNSVGFEALIDDSPIVLDKLQPTVATRKECYVVFV